MNFPKKGSILVRTYALMMQNQVQQTIYLKFEFQKVEGLLLLFLYFMCVSPISLSYLTNASRNKQFLAGCL